MKLFLNSKSLLIILTLSLSIWAYLVLLNYIGDPRVIDSGLDGEEMHFLELAFLYLSLTSTFYLWVCSFIHCFKNKSKILSIIIAVIWPLIYLYSFYVLGSNWRGVKAR
jgi:hypothetical protein